MKLHDKKVLVTGGTEGIGRALVDALMARGCHVLTCSRHAPTHAPTSNGHGRFTHIQCDLVTEAGRAELLAHIQAHHRDLSVVIHNAGVQHLVNFLEDPLVDIVTHTTQEVALNFLTPVVLTAALLPILRSRDDALVVNITTGLALAPKRSSPVYCATKAALRSFTRSLRYQTELAGGRVRVVEALPPLVETRMTAGRGSGKVSPAVVAQALIRGVEKRQDEIYIGKSGLLKVLYRLAPSLVERILKNW